MQEKPTTPPQSEALAAQEEQGTPSGTVTEKASGAAAQPEPAQAEPAATEQPTPSTAQAQATPVDAEADAAKAETASVDTETQPAAERAEAVPVAAKTQSSQPYAQPEETKSAVEEPTAEAHKSEEAAQPSHSFAGAQEFAGVQEQATTPVEAAAALPPSGAQRTFLALSRIAPLALLVLLLAQGWMWFIQPAPLLPNEQASLAMLTGTIQDGLWLAPMANANTAALPLFTWFSGIIALLPLPNSAWLPPIIALCAAAVALAGTYCLALACGMGSATAFASGLLLLACPVFIGASHYLSPDLLGAGVTAFALTFLLVGWKKERSFIALPLGFFFTALAALCSGLIAFALPLFASLFFILWTGRVRRAQKTDALAGFIIMLLVLLGWAGLVMITGTREAYLGLVWQNLFAPFAAPFWPPADALHSPLLLLLLAFLPWPLLLLTVSWGRVLKNAYSDLKASRNLACGRAWLWLAFMLGIALCMLASHKPASNLAPLLPLTAIVLAGALLRLGTGGSRILFAAIALLAIISGLLLAACLIPDVPALLQSSPLPEMLKPCLSVLTALGTQVQAVLILAGILVVSGALLLRFTCKRYAGGALLVCTVLTTLLVQPLFLQLSPALHAYLAPKAQEAPQPAAPLLSSPDKPAESASPAMPAQPENPAQAEPAASAPATTEAPTEGDTAAQPAESAEPSTPDQTAPEAVPAAPKAPAAPQAEATEAAQAAPADLATPAAKPLEAAPAEQEQAAANADTAQEQAPAAPEAPAKAE